MKSMHNWLVFQPANWTGAVMWEKTARFAEISAKQSEIPVPGQLVFHMTARKFL